MATPSKSPTVRRKTAWTTPQSLITLGLLAFLAVSVLAIVAKELGGRSPAEDSEAAKAASTMTDGVMVYYFHGNVRCTDCQLIEAYTGEAVEAFFPDELANGRLAFQVINYDTPGAQHFIADYQLVSPSVVLVRYDNGAQVDWYNLSGVWRLERSKSDFLTYIRQQTETMLQGVS